MIFSPQDPYPGRVAVLDLGTNTFILTIADCHEAGLFDILEDKAVVCRLGEGMGASREFKPEALQRCLDVLKTFAGEIQDYGCERVLAVGTAAFRHAVNAQDFVVAIERECGFQVDVISGEQEATLIQKAVLADFEQARRPLLILDIGGGSTEFVRVQGDGAFRKVSLPFGSVKLFETFLQQDPPSSAEISALQSFIRTELQKLEGQGFEDVSTLIATAGTATTVSALVQGLSQYNPQQIHGSLLNLPEVQKLCVRLESTPFAVRSTWPCLEPKRADVLLAGARILEAVMAHFARAVTYVSDRGLRYGVLRQFADTFRFV